MREIVACHSQADFLVAGVEGKNLDSWQKEEAGWEGKTEKGHILAESKENFEELRRIVVNNAGLDYT